jgi:chemotaxis protein methyltransferase CheR
MMPATLATEDYEFIRKLVYDQSRINLGADKMELVRSRVQKRLRALGLPDFESYCRLLESSAGPDELTELLDVISTNVTEFFREMRHFEYLREVVLPAWQNSARNSREPFRVWSSACSSGEEPYSIAILLADILGEQGQYDWRISASDISTRVLGMAQEAVYKAERVKLPKPEWLRAHFQKGVGAWDGHLRIKPALRQRVSFQRVNLFDSPYPFKEKFQVVFCRNVMIYFDRKTQEYLVPRLAQQLVPGGHLLVGHSESLVGLEHGLKCVRPSIYQKI